MSEFCRDYFDKSSVGMLRAMAIFLIFNSLRFAVLRFLSIFGRANPQKLGKPKNAVIPNEVRNPSRLESQTKEGFLTSFGMTANIFSESA